MSPLRLRRLWAGLKGWRRRVEPLDDLQNEFEAHLELAERDLLARGVAPGEARRLARLQFGNLRLLHEDARAHAGWPRLDALALDVRHALRRLWSDPATSCLAGLLLAVAIGLGAAMFTVADALLLRPAPFPDPDSLMRVNVGAAATGMHPDLGLPAYRAMRGTPGVRGLHIATQVSAVFDNGTMEDRLGGARITTGLLEELDARPLAGRTFIEDDARDGGRVLISETLWRDRLGADPDVLGRRLMISGRLLDVVGVLPATFTFPTSKTQVWFPFDPHASDAPRGSVWVFARISRDQPVAATAAALEHAIQALPSFERLRVQLVPMSRSFVDPYSVGIIRATSAAVALLFVVLCANAAGVLLTRMRRRRRMFALCAMLGAPRVRLLRQALVEQSAIAIAGVIGGVALAAGLVGMARTRLPRSLTFTSLNPLDLDGRALLATATLGAVTLVACGVAPAWLGRRQYAAPQGMGAGEGGGSERVTGRASMFALVAQTALAVLLCVGATVQWQSLANLVNVPPGIVADRLATFEVKLPDATIPIVDHVKALPGVEDATVSFGTPPSAGGIYFGSVTTDSPGASPQPTHVATYHVAENFFRAYGIVIEHGRALSRIDGPGAVVISRSLARQLWPDDDAVGHSFRFEDGKAFRVVGVARDVMNALLDPRADDPELYEALDQASAGPVTRYVTVRCRTSCTDVAPIRTHLLGAAAGLRVSEGTLVREEYALGLARPRAASLLAVIFAAVGTTAAATGLFVVLARAAASRQREFGIRLALGASPASLARLIGFTTARLLALALATSVLLAWPLGRMLQGVQHGTSIADPRAWILATLAVAAAAAAATIRPARQAAQTAVVTLLREE